MRTDRVSGMIIISLIFLLPALASAAPLVHPALLFSDIKETPGYRFRTIQPWSGYEDEVVRSAEESLSRNFAGNLGSYDRILYRGDFARDLGIAYQITKKPAYAQKAKEALLNLDVGSSPYNTDKSIALGGYSLAYDWIQPTLDPATDAGVRDKLATLADTVYKDLNNEGSSRDYVSFADYHGQAYPMMGIIGAVLSDYTNPNHLPLSSTPEDWHKTATEYLFVDDKLHSFGRSLFSFGFDEVSGKHLNGAYKAYVIDDFMWWLQIYYHVYKENPFEKYPAAKKAFTSELWESLPNSYSNNYVTNGNTKWVYQIGFINLLDNQSKSNALNHIEILAKSSLLPYSSVMSSNSPALLYCVQEDYSSVLRTFPTNTSHLDPDSIYQVIRKNWNNDSDWLSLVTFNKNTGSNRDMLHNDQLGFEYYSRGDLLLADAGEDKYVLDRNYGATEIHHNTVAIEDPRTPFPVSPWSGSVSAGIYKGAASGLATPSTVDTIIQTPWIELIETHVLITKVMVSSWGTTRTLSTPILYSRTILYPESDYFIVVDRSEGTQSWVYRNIFRPTSLMITPTIDANKNGIYEQSEVGHVNGALTIGSIPYNWLAIQNKTEINTGITTNSLTWITKNPYGKDVRLNLVSTPSSEILIEKNVGRIAGYDAPSEVFSPVIWLRTPAATSEYRLTALMSGYSTEDAKKANQLSVTGNGNAMKITSSQNNDVIYTGTGNSTFDEFTTDSKIAFIRTRGDITELTLIGCSFLDYQNAHWVSLSKKADSVTVIKESGTVNYDIQGELDISGEIFHQSVNPVKIQIPASSKETLSAQDSTNYQNIPSSTSAGSDEPFNIISCLKKIFKRVISFFT